MSLAFAVAYLALPLLPACAQPRTFEVRPFGAKGDGRTADSAAIQKALDACGRAGGGTVRFAPGTCLCQPIVLRTRTTLLLEHVTLAAQQAGLEICHARGVRLQNVKVTPRQGESFILHDAQVSGLDEDR